MLLLRGAPRGPRGIMACLSRRLRSTQTVRRAGYESGAMEQKKADQAAGALPISIEKLRKAVGAPAIAAGVSAKDGR